MDRDVPFHLDANAVAASDSFTFSTDAGDFDILGTPAGTRGFDDLAKSANPLDIDGYRVLVADVNDLIRMKLAAGRAKDLNEAEILGAQCEELTAYG